MACDVLNVSWNKKMYSNILTFYAVFKDNDGVKYSIPFFFPFLMRNIEMLYKKTFPVMYE